MSESKGNSIKVLLVDDEKFFLEVTADTLNDLGCEIDTAQSGSEAMEKLEADFYDVVVLDIMMPGMDGMQVLRQLQKDRPTQQVIMLTGKATVSSAIEAMKLGAFDFLLKPCKVDDLIRVIRRAADTGRLQRRNIVLEDELARTKGPGEIVGSSEALGKVHNFIEKAAISDLPVLITGESGTGKELVARAIHKRSKRSSNSMVVVDGSTLREELLASELFGHEKGAFTGAMQKKAGLFEIAHRGSVFLDEIGELSPTNQSALLRVLEYGVFRPLGSVKEVKTDIRIIAATNKNLKRAVEEKEFREDLYYRLKGLAINIPPLRERATDITDVIEYLLDHWNRTQRSNITISQQAWGALKRYPWPGNVRELKYVIELAALLSIDDGKIDLQHLPDEIRKTSTTAPGKTRSGKSQEDDKKVEGFWQIAVTGENLPLNDFRDICERSYILRLLKNKNGNKTQVARVLGISRSMLYEKIRQLDIR